VRTLDFSALIAGAPVLTDGAWGTQLQAHGLPAGECPDRWNLANPSAVAEVARSYVDAGSQVILTNTFRANFLSLDRFGLAAEAAAINRAGAALSCQAAGRRAFVFGSIGPVGELISVNQELREQAASAFSEQAKALADGGADALLIETMSDLEEAEIALMAAQKTGLPVVVSFAFDTGRARDRTMTGATPEQAAVAMTNAGAAAVGANCGDGIDQAALLCRRLRAATDLPVWLKPNAGMPVLNGDRLAYEMTPEQFASHLPVLVQAGATFVGGCCGTGPAFISAAANILERTRATEHVKGTADAH
jgi:methionine synthase I (cobalamin-dependent)